MTEQPAGEGREATSPTPDGDTATPPGLFAEGSVEERVNRALTMVGSAIAVASISVIGLVLVVGVALRYFMNSSADYATELPTYLFPWLISGGVIAAMGRGGHLAVDFFVARMAPARARVVDIAAWGLSTVVLIILTFVSLRLLAPLTAQVTPILGWPVVGSFAGFALAVVALTVQCGCRLVSSIRIGPVHAQVTTAGGAA
ncbi:hypothetical protein C1701_24250 [Actinoalloteichus sp. AHMU CJ021]|uniref:Tripartite ATP-independent transporter, DctQ component n=1 Tax=Actinoalloteichus caeruleus DSM 43889 TaxID=1120930 RepID=A0ABT1JD77_ACTCY|nr:TRAP transporter small permease subunit [Actinoalloteichus caeruleus]AUS80935.1 hypothetical protein C1701_24250 [Actinoalloteichus sp. AHMU CJ021]MCP2330378.1 Tripartite ATP-independent transporter, DctQ component [Actinoalloteichus caeruleus DSM 43889]